MQDDSGQAGEVGWRDDGQTLLLILKRISSEDPFSINTGDEVDPNFVSSEILLR